MRRFETFRKNVLGVCLLGLPVFLCLSSSFATGENAPNAPGAATLANVRTLKDLFVQALNHSERIALSEEAVREAEALYRQALGDALPDLFYRRQIALEAGGNADHDGMVRLSKTDLTGFRELAALRAGRSTVESRGFDRERVKQLLLQDIAGAFYAVLLAEENAAATEKLSAFAQERLQELKERVRVGRTREADAVGQEVLIASLQAQLEESRRQVKVRRNLLAFLAGVPVLDDAFEDVPLAAGAGSLEGYLARMETRPDIQAGMQNVQAARSLRQAARAEYLPSLNMTANSYTDRSGSSKDVDWDVLLSVAVPIWDGGDRRGSVVEAGSVLHQEELNLQLTRRQAGLEIQNAYQDYASAVTQREIRERAAVMARRDYEMQVNDDRQGLVTSLEVLAALDRLNSAELTLNNARLQEKLAVITLEIAAGVKPEEMFP